MKLTDCRLAAMLAIALAATASAVGDAPVALDWHLPPHASIEDGILTVDVPEDEARAGCRAWAEIDLSPYDGLPFEATVEAWGERIGKPRDHWNGLKFQFEYVNPDTGETLYPNTASRRGDFPRQTLTVRDSHCSHKAPPARLVLGLQDTSGKVSFDLSTLRVRPGRVFWPITNQAHRCEYTGSLADAAIHSGGITPLRGVMSPSRDMTEEDFRTLEAWGVTLLRYQMTRSGDQNANHDLEEFDHWLCGRLDHLDTIVLPLAEKHGIKVAIDLHEPPGGINGSNEMALFHDADCAGYFVAMWRRIAERFRGRSCIYGYDLINEPVQTAETLPDCDFWNLQRRAAEAIREIDLETPILIESNLMDSPGAFASLSPLTLTNIIYEVHMYNPGAFTHQNLHGEARPGPAYPDPAQKWDKAYLRRILAPVRDFQSRHGANIYVGEFSAVAWAQGAGAYLRDCISLFEEYGWDWTYHAFRQWPGWSVEHEGPDAQHLVPSADNPRKRALIEGLRGDAIDGDFEAKRREVLERRRLVIWDDDGCDMTHYPYRRADLASQPASVRNFELVFLEATENTRVDAIAYSGTMGFGYFTALRTGGDVNTNRFAGANEPWRNAVNEFAAMGKDAMDMATDFARRNGKEIFLSLRFNDNHDNAHPDIMLSPFKRRNPEVTVGHGGKVACCGPNAADFAQEKVRAFVKKFVRGYMENYDLDGIEFDFFRHPQLFRTVAMGGHATEEELAAMTRLMLDFRAMADEIGRKRGRPFILCARVPDSFDYCRAIGIDLDAWLRAGTLDFLVVGGYFQLEPWRETAAKVHGYGVKCYASLDETRIDQQVRRQKGRMLPGRNDKECWIARIAAAMASGMDGVNLFNIEYFDHEDQRRILRHDICDLDGVDKLYFGTYVGGGGYLPESFLVGGRDFWKTTGINPAWPVSLAAGAGHGFEFVFGDDLAAAKRKGLTPTIVVSVMTDLDGELPPTVKVRGKTLSGGVQEGGVATFAVDDETFAKGGNMVEIVAPKQMELCDFSVKVTFTPSRPGRAARGSRRRAFGAAPTHVVKNYYDAVANGFIVDIRFILPYNRCVSSHTRIRSEYQAFRRQGQSLRCIAGASAGAVCGKARAIACRNQRGGRRSSS